MGSVHHRKSAGIANSAAEGAAAVIGAPAPVPPVDDGERPAVAAATPTTASTAAAAANTLSRRRSGRGGRLGAGPFTGHPGQPILDLGGRHPGSQNIALQQAVQHRCEAAGVTRPVRRALADVGLEDGRGRLATVRRPPLHGVVQRRAQRPHVGAIAGDPVGEPFRRHVVG